MASECAARPSMPEQDLGEPAAYRPSWLRLDNAILSDWQAQSAESRNAERQRQDTPDYWANNPESLFSESCILGFLLGSGDSVFASILPAIEAAEYEVILVTCFWARSSTLDKLNDALRKLSAKGQRLGRKIRVRICFSSLSLIQKLFHTRSLEGHVYPPSVWEKRLHLPEPSELLGLDLEIKSVFVLPFSVMHPKFIIVDRSHVFLPSCNVSWEVWFEGCIEITGSITVSFLRFWKSFWASHADRSFTLPSSDLRGDASTLTSPPLLAAFWPSVLNTRTLFLPSPHHCLSLFDSISRPTTLPTPLNLFILSVLGNASHSIYIQTPNLTSRAVLDGIVSALGRGTDVHIVTSRRLMILEQLVTARTTTARCVSWLIRQHRQLKRARSHSSPPASPESADREVGPESGPGILQVGFYEPKSISDASEPVQSHLKLTIADEELVLLGSGNLDRASWTTSQELGVAFLNRGFAGMVMKSLEEGLAGRVCHLYPEH